MTVGDEKLNSIVKINTTNPIWDENYSFFIPNPEHEFLSVKINDKKFNKTLANVEISVSELLKAQNMTIDREYDLSCFESHYIPRVHLVLRLRVKDLI